MSLIGGKNSGPVPTYSTRSRCCWTKLPRIYTPELYEQKCDSVYRHVFDSYQGEGKSVYAAAR